MDKEHVADDALVTSHFLCFHVPLRLPKICFLVANVAQDILDMKISKDDLLPEYGFYK